MCSSDLIIAVSPSRLPLSRAISSHALTPHVPSVSATPSATSTRSWVPPVLVDPASLTRGLLQGLGSVEVAAGAFFTRLQRPLTWRHCMQALDMPPLGVHSSPLSRHRVQAVSSSESTAAGR